MLPNLEKQKKQRERARERESNETNFYVSRLAFSLLQTNKIQLAVWSFLFCHPHLLALLCLVNSSNVTRNVANRKRRAKAMMPHNAHQAYLVSHLVFTVFSTRVQRSKERKSEYQLILQIV